METTKRILWNKFNKSDNKSEWLDYIKTVSEEWYLELRGAFNGSALNKTRIDKTALWDCNEGYPKSLYQINIL